MRSIMAAAAIIAGLVHIGAQQPGLSKFDRQVAQQMLKQIREDLEKHYYDPKFRGIDLDAKAKEASARLDAAANASEASIVIADLLLSSTTRTRHSFHPTAPCARSTAGA